ncbi:hypothetical protein MRX96_054566 [Rhipicephalus microplus]
MREASIDTCKSSDASPIHATQPSCEDGGPFVSYTKATQAESLLVQGHFSSGPDTASVTAARHCANNEDYRPSCLSPYNQENRAAKHCDAGDVDQVPRAKTR